MCRYYKDVHKLANQGLAEKIVIKSKIYAYRQLDKYFKLFHLIFSFLVSFLPGNLAKDKIHIRFNFRFLFCNQLVNWRHILENELIVFMTTFKCEHLKSFENM